jgi:hypothetical protein
MEIGSGILAVEGEGASSVQEQVGDGSYFLTRALEISFLLHVKRNILDCGGLTNGALNREEEESMTYFFP